jgi:carbon-monoxide dehydrogenase large subunit
VNLLDPTIGGPGIAARYVGASVHRKEDRRLLTGHGRYVDDVRPDGMLHAAFVRSDVARGRLGNVDVAAARDLPGVVAVFTAGELEGRYGESWHPILGESLPVPPPLAVGDVRHVGEPIAMVVAVSRYVAEDACQLVDVEIEASVPCVDYRSAVADRHVHDADGVDTNVMLQVPFTVLPEGAPLDATFSTAHRVVEVSIEQNRYLAVPMETRGIVADYDPGREELDITCATQTVHETRNFFARYLSIPESSIRVEARDVGGGFGQKGRVFREECAVVLASKLLGRAVKWIEDRRENLMAAGHSRNERGTVRLAIAEDDTIEAIAIDHVADIGAYPISPSAINAGLLPGPYRIPQLGYSTAWVWTNTMGRTAYRGPWLFESTAREMAIDHAARVLAVDPIALRRRNLLSSRDLPFTSPSGNVFEDITPLETFEQALQALGYDQFRAEQRRARDEGRWLGLGCCVYVEPSAMRAPTLATEAATVRVEPSGRVLAFLGTTSHGQSIETTMAQVVADTVGVAYDDVTVVQGDSQSTPYGPITGGSRTAVIAGGAARRAALAVRAKVLEVASAKMEANPADLDIEDGTVVVRGTPSRSMTMREVATAAYRFADQLPPELAGGLEATERFKPSRFPTWSNATHLCVVEVDPGTYAVKVLRYVVSEDCGTMINPTIVDGQISGGTVQGLGGVLLENFVYDVDGVPLTTTFLDYLLPTASDVPDIEIHHLSTPSSTNPGGFKGMGEGGAIGSHAAVANAVGDALAHLGVHVTSTPLGPLDIHELVCGVDRATT